MTSASFEEIDAAVAGDTVPKAFLRTVAANGSVVALRRQTSAAPETWEELTYDEFAAKVAQAAAGLQAAGLQQGEKLVMMMRNRPEFHVVDTAAQFLRATPVSIYNSSSPEEIEYQANHCEATIAVLEDSGFLERFLKVRESLPDLRTIYVIEPPEVLPEGCFAYADLFGDGAADLATLAEATDPNDLATLIYTSGTTGPPKGVMISQYNVMFTVDSLLRTIEFQDSTVGKRIVSYLPMAHIAERAMSHYQQLVLGYTVTCCPDPTQIAAYARSVRPQILFGVPRVWEKVYAGVNGALGLDPEKKAKFEEGLALALQIKQAERDGTATQEQLDTWAFLDAVAFSTVRQLVGLDAIELAVTGAAPLPREILEWFNAIGVPLSEVYGMSESTGPMTFSPRANKPGYVGQTIPGSETRIADDGEVVFRGGNVFQGYFKAPDKTADTIIDGWLHSGDIGELDADGYLKIVDRKKELIITAGGKNISPANLEAALKTIPLIGQAAAIGDARKFIAAILVLDPELAPLWAMGQGIAFTDLADLATKPEVIAEVQKGVDEVNERFAQVEQIKKFTLLGEEWLPDSDVLTPTSKLKRRGVNARYGEHIEAMYAE